jgi:glycosyltransferase involved in cell wall biosynthesis
MSSQYPPVIVHIVHSLEGGGTERMLVSLLHGFDPARGRHAVVTLRGAGSLAATLPDHVACRPIEAAGRSRSACLKLARLTREWKANVIHARNTGCWYDATVASLLTPGSRLVLGFHGLETGRTFSRRQRRLARWGLCAGTRFTSVSNAGKRQLCEQADIAAERIDVLRNGIDLRPFAAPDPEARRKTRRRFRFDDSAFVVGIVGSLTPVKQHAVLIGAVARAVRHVPAIRLMIVGDGPLRSTLGKAALRPDRAQAEGIAGHVCFTGWCDDVPAMLAGMDAYVCSSESEGMNNALLEAMAAALPIVATDVGDNAVVLRNQREGLLVKPGSTSVMAEALVHLAGSAMLRRRLSDAGRSARASLVGAFGFSGRSRSTIAGYRTCSVSDRWGTATGHHRTCGTGFQPVLAIGGGSC